MWSEYDIKDAVFVVLPLYYSQFCFSNVTTYSLPNEGREGNQVDKWSNAKGLRIHDGHWKCLHASPHTLTVQLIPTLCWKNIGQAFLNYPVHLFWSYWVLCKWQSGLSRCFPWTEKTAHIAKSMHCSRRWREVNTDHPHWKPHNLLSLQSHEYLTSSFGFRRHCIHVHTYT